MIDQAAMICIAIAVYHEARGEPVQGREAVAHVIMERAADRRWPDHPCDVVYQRHQFSFVSRNESPPVNEGSTQWQDAVRIARAKLAGNLPTPQHLDGANHYHAQRVSPKWTKSMKKKSVIGRHVFYDG